jgi:predicted secreted protein
MQFVLMFGVMLILHIPCLFVLLRLAVRSRESEDHPGTWNLES